MNHARRAQPIGLKPYLTDKQKCNLVSACLLAPLCLRFDGGFSLALSKLFFLLPGSWSLTAATFFGRLFSFSIHQPVQTRVIAAASPLSACRSTASASEPGGTCARPLLNVSLTSRLSIG